MAGGGQAGNVAMGLYVDGVLNVLFGCSDQPTSFNQIAVKYRHKPAAGNHTYVVKGARDNTNAAAQVNQFYLYATDNKTQA